MVAGHVVDDHVAERQLGHVNDKREDIHPGTGVAGDVQCEIDGMVRGAVGRDCDGVVGLRKGVALRGNAAVNRAVRSDGYVGIGGTEHCGNAGGLDQTPVTQADRQLGGFSGLEVVVGIRIYNVDLLDGQIRIIRDQRAGRDEQSRFV